MYNSNESVPKVLDPESAKAEGEDKVSFINDESSFRFQLNEDEMATEKLSDGIRKFSADIVTLFDLIEKKVTA